jgi:hypothetical protein
MTRIMTDAERKEIAEIERRKKVEFEAALKALGPAFSAREPRLS